MFFRFFLWAQQTSRKISMFGSNTSSRESLLEMPWESDIGSQSASRSSNATATPWFQMQKKWLILRRPQWRTKKESAQERCHAILKEKPFPTGRLSIYGQKHMAEKAGQLRKVQHVAYSKTVSQPCRFLRGASFQHHKGHNQPLVVPRHTLSPVVCSMIMENQL